MFMKVTLLTEVKHVKGIMIRNSCSDNMELLISEIWLNLQWKYVISKRYLLEVHVIFYYWR